MAQIEFSPLVQNIQGSISGVTFRRLGPKSFVSPKSPGPPRRVFRSTEHLTYLKNAHALWNSTDETTRRTWNQYVAYERVIHPWTGRQFRSGRDLFITHKLYQQHSNQSLTSALIYAPVISTGGTVQGWPFWIYDEDFGGWFQFGAAYSNDEVPGYSIFYAAVTYRDNESPGRFVRKIFPLAGEAPANGLTKLSERVFSIFGPPRGISPLQTAPTPEGYTLWLRVVKVHTSRLAFSYWTKATNKDWFRYPYDDPNPPE